MSWRTEKTDEGSDLVWDGVETGIAPSPTKGTANLQNVNISTESGEVMASYTRTNEAQAAITNGTLTASTGDGATLLDAPSTLKAGTWVRVSASSISSITAATSPSTVAIDYLVIGGGGGGGSAYENGASGGGGAGQMAASSSTAAVGSYVVTVGAGGAGGTSLQKGVTGSSSSLGAIVTAVGGGGGGLGISNISPSTAADGANGASGGGGGQAGDATPGTGGTATAGNNGGVGFASTTSNLRAGGGGGGASAVGAAAVSAAGGAGGAGSASSITGTSVTYAGGGGGGAVGTAGIAGSGGGGAGGDTAAGTAGTDGKGGGGGGSSTSSSTAYAGAAGGSGIVIISYATGAMYATGGVITHTSTNTVHTFTSSGVFKVVGIATGGLYYVSYKDTNNKVKLSSKYDPTGANAITHGTSGTATFSTVATPGSAIAKATEKYMTATATEYRYYIMDTSGYTWVYDTAIYDSSLSASGVATLWMLPDPTDYSSLKFTGMATLNGWLMQVCPTAIYGKSTVTLGKTLTELPGVVLNNAFSTHSNFAYTGSQGKMYYCDNTYIGELFPTTSLATSIANIQSYCAYTITSGTTTTIDLSKIIGGSKPYDPSGEVRIPVVFFTDSYGTRPTAITEDAVYYLKPNSGGSYTVYTALTGGSTVDVSTGAVGTQYFNTFYPLGAVAAANGTDPLVQFTAQRVNLPFYEAATSLVEIGNTVLIGAKGSVVYPWNQIDATPSDFIALPESGVATMVNVNNMAYIFAGNKGNVYITNGSVASLALSVPDYAAGVPGTPLTYIEPYFTWGDAAYVRGRVYFSILDQTATKAGNCGGVWSFVPTQNSFQGLEVGLALRLENQNSYGTYSGYATILLPNQEQAATSPQYWASWQSTYTGTTYGIDNTGTVPVTTYVVETDILPTGTLLSKDTFSQLEYKLTTPLATGDSVQLYYRLNATDAWTSCGTTRVETTNPISGYYDMNFERTQWVQFRVVATTVGTTASSFVRLKQVRMR